MRKLIAMFALAMFTVITSHASYFTLSVYPMWNPTQATITQVEDGGPVYPGSAYYQYTYTQPDHNDPGITLQVTSGWIPFTGATFSIPSNATFTDIRVQRFHIFTGAPVGPLYDLW